MFIQHADHPLTIALRGLPFPHNTMGEVISSEATIPFRVGDSGRLIDPMLLRYHGAMMIFPLDFQDLACPPRRAYAGHPFKPRQFLSQGLEIHIIFALILGPP
jgi:hypothetical protein